MNSVRPEAFSGRAVVVAAGLGALAFGAWQLLGGGRVTNPLSSVPWLIGSLVVHDGVLAPLAVLVGAVLVKVLPLPPTARRVLAVGLFVGVCLVLVALPALGTPGVGDNPTATPRDYPRGLLILLVIVAVSTVAGLAAAVVAGQRSDGDEQDESAAGIVPDLGR